ncbi:uncharacterized protein HMPREF1541_00861 [Cyphellophora europaea CBS 101466]|uniref:MARVEL domain-containing protein n=1 Tax=Cyphellophora europaea (strain CBS 101466) TaxID=1220924 RepID=W2SFI8_CYPE1|nr:uncharacterized protein HMPREF1541_00861 [Cyphellophora europaea CBS 101466]ETN46674.1 hypothetical protein HMPREF1541_00861 [Cyphellophora europaea CBS 101466]
MISSKPRNAPSAYPFPLTYLVLSVSFVFSAIATGLLGYFIYYLNMDSMPVPFEFILLITTSTLSLCAYLWASFTHLFRTMTPKISLATNTLLLLLWIISTALISRKISHMVLTNSCSLSMWRTDMGVMVCRIYKALFAFIILAAASVAATVALDVHVLREMTSRGAYREMKDQQEATTKAAWGGVQRAAEPSPALDGYRRGFSIEMKDSPELGSDMGDGARLVARSPDPGYTPQQTPKL